MKRNKFFSKRRLASFVALVLSVNTLSVTAWAGSFTDLQREINNAQEGKVVLGEDYWYQNGDALHIDVTGTVDLNLNGHTIQGSGTDSVIYVRPGASLTLRDDQGAEPTTTNTGNPNLPTNADDEAGTTEKVGTITGGAAQNGGGIHVGGNGNKATFIMEGGTITDNTTKSSGWTGGAGVYVYNANFIMNGGKITGNTAVNDAAGVELDQGAKFVMNGGEITGNTAAGEGGGISLKLNSQFEMNGGRITGNIGNGVSDDISQISKPNRPSNSTVTINAGTVTEKVADKYGAGPCRTDAGIEDENVTDENPVVTVHGEHIPVPDESINKPATCDKTGWEDATKCSECGKPQDAGKETPATGDHHFGEWSDWVVNEAEGKQTQTRTCDVCGYVEENTESLPVKPDTGDNNGDNTDTPENPDNGDNTDTPENPDTGDKTETPETPETPEEPETPVTPETPEEPETPVTPETPEEPETPDTGDTGTTEPETPADGGTFIPDDETPLAADPTAAPAADADTTVITDEPIPLAGLITRAQLLAELYRYEQRPEVVLPEEFDFAEHEYALAICWGLDNALEIHTEDDPYLPDDLLTVGVLREVLVNFVAYKGIEDLEFTVEGEDDELVMDLDVRLAAFYELLEAAEA